MKVQNFNAFLKSLFSISFHSTTTTMTTGNLQTYENVHQDLSDACYTKAHPFADKFLLQAMPITNTCSQQLACIKQDALTPSWHQKRQPTRRVGESSIEVKAKYRQV